MASLVLELDPVAPVQGPDVVLDRLCHGFPGEYRTGSKAKFTHYLSC